MTGATLSDQLTSALGHRIADAALLEAALTHASALEGAADDGAESYQRLEFLGDRVLGLVVAELLMELFPAEPEGALAKRHAVLVRRETCAQVALEAGMAPHIRLSGAGGQERGTDHPSILADVCEAVIGAIYLDGGLQPAQRFIRRYWVDLVRENRSPPQDAKTRLQEWAQRRGLDLPRYEVVERSGPDHDPNFIIEVSVAGGTPARGTGPSKRKAEQQAAEACLRALTQKVKV